MKAKKEKKLHGDFWQSSVKRSPVTKKMLENFRKNMGLK